MLDYLVVYDSETGNTKKIATEIFASLPGKSVALFGTCGARNSPEYYKEIASSVRIWLEDDNHYLGSFICQGKMPLAVRQKYESLLNTPKDCDCQQIRRQLQNFDEAMIHPTRTDLENATLFATECIEKVKSL